MKINKIIIFVIIFLKICGNAISEEIDFNASQIKLKEDGDITYATDAELNLPLKNIKITVVSVIFLLKIFKYMSLNKNK